MEVFLVSPNFIRSVSNIDSNTQDKYITTAIRESQDTELQEILGTNLLNKIKSLVENDTISEPENHIYNEIVDKAKYLLTYSVIARLCVISSFKIANMGVSTTTDDNVQAVNFDDVFKLEHHYINKADSYKRTLQAFLEHNRKHIPELYDNCCHETQSNTYSAGTCNIWLGGTRGRRKSV